MYKDKEKQRESNKKAQARRRQGMTHKGMTEQASVIPEQQPVIPCKAREKMVQGDGVAPKVQHFNPMMVGYEPLPQ